MSRFMPRLLKKPLNPVERISQSDRRSLVRSSICTLSTAIWLIASDILVALVNPRGRSLHDVFFATRVAYDFKDLDLPKAASS